MAEFLVRSMDHIPRQILGFLDLTSIVRCLRLSKTIKAFIENERFLYLSKSRLLRKSWKVTWRHCNLKRDSFLGSNHHPHWIKVFDHFENEANIEDLQEFVWFMKSYYRRSENDGALYSPLVHAARVGSLKVLKYCFDNKFPGDPYHLSKKYYNEYHPDCRSPLVMACKKGRADVVRLILSYAHIKDVGINQSDDRDRTAFHWACKIGHLEIVKLLLDHLKTTLSNSDLTPVEKACEKYWKDFEATQSSDSDTDDEWDRISFVRLDPNARTQQPHDNAVTGFHYACQNGHLDVVEYLLEKSAELNINVNAKDQCHTFEQDPRNGMWNPTKDTSRKTGLHWACKKGRLEVVKTLLLYSKSNHLDMDAGTLSGASMVIYACEQNWIRIVEVFITHSKASFKNCDANGQTAFMRACILGNYEIVDLLLKHADGENINIFANDNEGFNALELASRNEWDEIVALIEFENRFI